MGDTRFERVSAYDFAKIYKQDWNADQDYHINTAAANYKGTAGSGVLPRKPVEDLIFDSDALTNTQSNYVSVNTFDGRGILASPYTTSDQSEGNQIAVTISDARLDGILSTYVILLGKDFQDELKYEILEIPNNMTEVSYNHFKEITNILFQNFRGNANTSVDGYGSFNVGGRCVIREASAMQVGRDCIVAEQIDEPQMVFRNFKTYTSGKNLSTVLEEAVGSSNDVDDLDINTTTSKTRTFTQGDTTDLIFGQKFKMRGDNIQKVSLLLSLSSGSNWSGTLVVGIRPLQTSETSTSEFLPDDEIGFDADTVPAEEVAWNQDDFAERGYKLNTDPQIIDFTFTDSNISNGALSKLVDGDYYVLTIRRTGSTSTGSIVLQEARNDADDTRLTVFDNSVWTDVEDSALWFRVWNDSLKVSTGTAYVDGIRLAMEKTKLDGDTLVQDITSDVHFVDTSEDTENYLLVERSVEFSDEDSHPRTGDAVFTRKEDKPSFSLATQSSVTELMDAGNDVLLLSRAIDDTPRQNPDITGTFTYPGLAVGNTIQVIGPSSDLLNHNVVGSTITPNTSKPNLTYRITSQTTYTDLYGDLDGDDDIDLDDATRVGDLDGYAPDLSSGTVAAATQKAAVVGGAVTVPEILRGDTNADGYIDSSDLAEINAYIDSGTAFSAGSSFTRVELKVEPILDPQNWLDGDGNSTLELQDEDPDLINNSSFSNINWSIAFVPTWYQNNIQLTDLRRFVNATFTDFDTDDLSSTPETGGQNNFYAPGNIVLGGSILEEDSTLHPLDYEEVVLELDLPEGDTEGELNLFTNFVSGKMKFSDGTTVAATALNNNQVQFNVSVSSFAKNTFSSGDGYVDFDGYGSDAEEVVATYMEHTTGILRIKAYNIVHNTILPEIRTRILVTVSLKKAGFANSNRRVLYDEVARLLT